MAAEDNDDLEVFLDGPGSVGGEKKDDDGVRTFEMEQRAWLVRLGEDGEYEDISVSEQKAFIGWNELPTVPADVNDDWLKQALDDTYPEFPKASRANFLGQLFPFMCLIKNGDVIISPSKKHPGDYLIGECIRPYEDLRKDETDHHSIGVEWHENRWSREIFGSSIRKSLNNPRTIGWLDDNASLRLTSLLKSGSARRYWWINQGTSWNLERESGVVCAPRRSQDGSRRNHHLNVARIQSGDVLLHYQDGHVIAVGEALEDAKESLRPYETAKEYWQEQVFLASCWHDVLVSPIPLAEIGNRNSTSEPFNTQGGVKQGYAWALDNTFVANFVSDHAPVLRGTPLANEATWIFQGNPDRFDVDGLLNSLSPGDSYDWTLSRYRTEVSVGDRVLIWKSGSEAGVYALARIEGKPFERTEAENFTQGVSTDVAVSLRFERLRQII